MSWDGFISLSSAPKKEQYIWQLQEWCIPTVTSLSITFFNNYLAHLKKSLPFWSHPHLENGLYPASCCILRDSTLIYLLVNHFCLFPVMHLHLLSPSSWTIASPISIVSGLYSSLERPLFVSYLLQTHSNHPKVPFWGWCCYLGTVLQPLSDPWAVALRP